jgi:serine/threonine-protein kinase
VYKGRVQATGQPVAVKVLHESMGWDPQVRERFVREATNVRRLDEHPSVIRTYELVAEPDGRLAIVMEYIQGQSLDERITARPALTGAEAVAICASLLEAIGHLHEQGLYRLDVKPSNVMLRHGTQPVIIDLGIAKVLEQHSEKTQTGVVIGTPAYLAPEQLSGERADHRSDLFSLGLVLFEMLTGERINIGANLWEIVAHRINQDVPVETVSCSSALASVLRKLTERRAQYRYQDARAALADLLATPEAEEGRGETTSRESPVPSPYSPSTIRSAQDGPHDTSGLHATCRPPVSGIPARRVSNSEDV